MRVIMMRDRSNQYSKLFANDQVPRPDPIGQSVSSWIRWQTVGNRAIGYIADNARNTQKDCNFVTSAQTGDLLLCGLRHRTGLPSAGFCSVFLDCEQEEEAIDVISEFNYNTELRGPERLE